jgi:hypothetical protein
MPQYIRENGAIKVIPDDNTTEDGEIDLSPRRKIIDEGNIIIEGQDDGSTVIREKRPTDHTFFGNSENFSISESINITGGNYFRDTDEYVFGNFSDDKLFVVDASDPSSSKRFLNIGSGSSKGGIVENPLSKSLYAYGDSSGDISVVSKNDSTGSVELSSTISTPNNEIATIYTIPYLNLILVLGDSEITYIDAITESVIGNDTDFSASTGGIVDGFFTNGLFSPRSDRQIYFSYKEGTSINEKYVISPTDKSSFDLGENTEKYRNVEYSEKTDNYTAIIDDEDQIAIIDGQTLKEVKRVETGIELSSGLYRSVSLEGRFVIYLSDQKNLLFLVDSKNASVLETLDVRLANISVFFDPTRNKIVTGGSDTEGFQTILYNPFYS